jgi:hypothetical protein
MKNLEPFKLMHDRLWEAGYEARFRDQSAAPKWQVEQVKVLVLLSGIPGSEVVVEVDVEFRLLGQPLSKSRRTIRFLYDRHTAKLAIKNEVPCEYGHGRGPKIPLRPTTIAGAVSWDRVLPTVEEALRRFAKKLEATD